MSAGNQYNLSLISGESHQTRITWQNDGSPVDLTGYTVKAEIRIASSDVTASGAFTASVATPASSGTVVLSLAPSSSALLTNPCYVYDCRVTSGSTFSKVLVAGKLTVQQRVTK